MRARESAMTLRSDLEGNQSRWERERLPEKPEGRPKQQVRRVASRRGSRRGICLTRTGSPLSAAARGNPASRQ